MTFYEYAHEEVRLTNLQIARASHRPLADRQSARAAYANALASRVHRIASEVDAIVGGYSDCGLGSQALAIEILQAGPRRNKAAALSALVAGLGFQCPAAFARQAYLSLDEDQRDWVDAFFAETIRDLTATIQTHTTTRDIPTWLQHALHMTVNAVHWADLVEADRSGQSSLEAAGRISHWAQQPVGQGGVIDLDDLQAVAKVVRLANLDSVSSPLDRGQRRVWRSFLSTGVLA